MKLETFSTRIKSLLASHGARIALFGGSVLVIALLAFQAGLLVGYHKASFAYRFSDRYREAFGRGPGPGSPGMFIQDFAPAHGAAGTIVKVELPSIIINDHGTEKVVKIERGTVIRSRDQELASSTLKAGDSVVVVGDPDDSADITAALIRVFPPGFVPPNFTAPTSSPPRNN